jgi:hypothetical protein
MEIRINPYYIYVFMILWIAPVITAVWGMPIWTTITFLCAFAIYSMHEWIHLWICKINGLEVKEISLIPLGKTHIIFEKSESRKITRDVYLAGAAWDSIFYSIAILSCLVYSFHTNDQIPLYFGCTFIIMLTLNLVWPGSDFSHFKALTKPDLTLGV